MDVAEALSLLKFLVRHNRFHLVRRRARMAMPVSRNLAKEIVAQLSVDDFIKVEANRNNPSQYVWIFKTEDGETYYIKFVFIDDDTNVIFISFHVDY